MVNDLWRILYHTLALLQGKSSNGGDSAIHTIVAAADVDESLRETVVETLAVVRRTSTERCLVHQVPGEGKL